MATKILPEELNRAKDLQGGSVGSFEVDEVLDAQERIEAERAMQETVVPQQPQRNHPVAGVEKPQVNQEQVKGGKGDLVQTPDEQVIDHRKTALAGLLDELGRNYEQTEVNPKNIYDIASTLQGEDDTEDKA